MIAATVIAQPGHADKPTAGATTTVTAPPVTLTPASDPPVERTILGPAPESLADVCTKVTVKPLVLPDGKALVVAQKLDGENRIYFYSQLDVGVPGAWSTMVDLGDRGEADHFKGRKFSIWAVILDRSMVDYSVAVNRDGQQAWSATTFPPTSDPGQPLRVTGSGVKGNC